MQCSFADGLEDQHHCLELDAGCDRKPVEVTEEGGHMGEFGDTVTSSTGTDSSMQGVLR